jgi:hypothetical protein
MAALGGCAGGSASGLIPARPLALAQPQPGGPVAYLQSDGPLASSGSIAGAAGQTIVAVMSGAFSDSPQPFAADTLTLSTGSTPQSLQQSAPLRTAVPAAIPAHMSPAEAFAVAPSVRLRPATAAPSALRLVRSVFANAPAVGTSAEIWVQQGALSAGTRANVQVASTLRLQTAHGNIWIDDTLANQIGAAALQQIGADFENAYASDTEHFASPDYGTNAPGRAPSYQACAADGSVQGTTPAYIAEPPDGRINVLIVSTGALGGMGGYFSSVNYMPQAALNCLGGSYRSNEAPFIFVGWTASNGASYELREDLVRGSAHELQHLINFVNHAILPAAASSASFNGNEDSFINEGLSMLAQDLAVARMYGSQGVAFDADDALARAAVYLQNPQHYSVSGFTGIDPAGWGADGTTAQWNCSAGCYGAAYLFQRYLYDRFGGDAYTHAVETGGTGTAHLAAVTGETAGSLLDDFALALAAGSVNATGQPQFSLGALKLSTSYDDQFGGATRLPAVTTEPATGPQQVQAPVGGFAFVSVGAVPAAGMPVKITDNATAPGFGLAGGLAQQQ